MFHHLMSSGNEVSNFCKTFSFYETFSLSFGLFNTGKGEGAPIRQNKYKSGAVFLFVDLPAIHFNIFMSPTTIFLLWGYIF